MQNTSRCAVYLYRQVNAIQTVINAWLASEKRTCLEGPVKQRTFEGNEGKNPTAVIYTFSESPTYLLQYYIGVYPGRHFALLTKIVDIIPREAEGYSVELFGLSVRLSVPPLEGSIASRLRPHLSPHNDDSYIFGNPK